MKKYYILTKDEARQVGFEEMASIMTKDYAERKNESYNKTKLTIVALIKGNEEFNMKTPTARYVVATFKD